MIRQPGDRTSAHPSQDGGVVRAMSRLGSLDRPGRSSGDALPVVLHNGANREFGGVAGVRLEWLHGDDSPTPGEVARTHVRTCSFLHRAPFRPLLWYEVLAGSHAAAGREILTGVERAVPSVANRADHALEGAIAAVVEDGRGGIVAAAGGQYEQAG